MVRAAIVSALAVGLSVMPAGAAQASSAAGAEAAAVAVEGSGECPAVVVVAARGSDQDVEHGEYPGPQTYSPAQPPSNGWEGPNFAAFFHFVQEEYGAMDKVFVLGLDKENYPATMGLPPLARRGEDLTPMQIAQRLGAVLRAQSVDDIVRKFAIGVYNSVRTGNLRAPQVIEAWEAKTGCAPDYVVAGYSQGAIISTNLERYLAGRGRLLGAITIGNPLAPHGILQFAPDTVAGVQLKSQPVATRRIDYCQPGDFVCDLSPQSAADALGDKAQRHASYFLTSISAPERQAAAAFAGWVGDEGSIDK